MRLHLYAFGKLKTPGLREAADHYKSNLRSWVSLEEVEIKPLSVADKSTQTRRSIQENENELLLKRLGNATSGRAVFYILDETGKAQSTQAWAELIRNWEREGYPQVSLCIGSSLGFSAKIRTQADGILSLGPQTLSYELSRVVLLEQLFRAWSVVRGHPYHNQGA